MGQGPSRNITNCPSKRCVVSCHICQIFLLNVNNFKATIETNVLAYIFNMHSIVLYQYQNLKAHFVLKSKSFYGFQFHFSPLILSSMFGFIFLFVVFPSSMLPFILGFCCLMLFYVFWCSSQSFMHKCSIYYKSRDRI